MAAAEYQIINISWICLSETAHSSHQGSRYHARMEFHCIMIALGLNALEGWIIVRSLILIFSDENLSYSIWDVKKFLNYMGLLSPWFALNTYLFCSAKTRRLCEVLIDYLYKQWWLDLVLMLWWWKSEELIWWCLEVHKFLMIHFECVGSVPS